MAAAAVCPESGADGEESDAPGADERSRAEELQPGVVRPPTSRSSAHAEAAVRDRLLP